jgi:hypothetical protein
VLVVFTLPTHAERREVFVLQVPAWHTPEEMRQLSDLAHRIEGALLGTVAAIALAQAGRRWSSVRAQLLWPVLLLTAGVILLGYLLIPHHGLDRAGDQWRFVLGDAQQRQHVILALLVAIGGGSELFYRAGRLRSRLWQLGMPAAAVTIGLLFALHAQHGTTEAVARAILIHRTLGTLLITTGMLRAFEVLTARHRRWLSTAWPLTLLAASVLLVVYREPEGAYETGRGTHSGH